MGLYIKSTNAASYITTATGVKAKVVSYTDPDNGRTENYFEFPEDEAVMESFRDYREAVGDRLVLPVDLVEFQKNFAYYRKESKKMTYGRRR